MGSGGAGTPDPFVDADTFATSFSQRFDARTAPLRPIAQEQRCAPASHQALSNVRFGAALGVVGAVDIAPSRLPGDVTASAYDRAKRSCPPAGRRSSSALIEGPVTTV